ncbi:hypothetical protein HK097_006451, partial [Rhizophlyctis rosea]
MDAPFLPDSVLSFIVTYKGTAHPLFFPSTATLADLREALASKSDINLPPPYQKLVIKGKSHYEDSTPLTTLPTSKIMLVGSTPTDINIVQKQTSIAQARAARFSQKPSSSSSRPSQPMKTLSSLSTESYTFQTFTSLPQFPDHQKALALLHKLASDTGIKTIMQNHKWSVGALIELHPAERTILGYNQNKGQTIALRIRTDDLDGFRHYDSIRKVLLHELSHMVFSEHDEKFHALNRQLNRE